MVDSHVAPGRRLLKIAMSSVVQINLHRARAAHDELEHRVRTEEIDICTISESKTKMNERKKQTDDGWLGDPDGDTATWLTGRNRNLRILKKETKKGRIWMLVTGSLLITSCYYSPKKELDDSFPD